MDLRRRVLALHELPRLPEYVSALLADPGEAWPSVRLVSLLQAQPALRNRLMASLPGGGESSGISLAEVLRRLGRLTTCEIVLQFTLLEMFPRESGAVLDRSRFWQQAFASAELSAALATLCNAVDPPQAYAAGLLHDIGKLVLDHLAPDQLQKALECARTNGTFILEAEQKEIGTDHATAGKWLAEAWRLPDWLTALIWLHHHPLTVLQAEEEVCRLVDVVLLADMFARQGTTNFGHSSRISPSAEERCRRLGLNAEQLASLQPGRPPWEDGSPQFARDEPGDPAEELRRLQVALERLQGLQEMTATLAGCETEERALHHFTRTLRARFQVPAGMCLISATEDGSLSGKSWKCLAGEIENLFIPREDSSGRSKMMRLFRQVLRTTGVGRAGSSIEAGLLVLPLTLEGQPFGQMLLDFAPGSPPDADRLGELLHFAGVGAELIGRCRRTEWSAQRQEALSTSLWKQELQFQQRLRAERLSSVAKLAAGAAHEINNPLAIISGQAQILMSRSASVEEKRALDIIVQQARRAGKVLLDMMQFARPAPPKPEPVLVTFLLHQLLSQGKERLEQRGVQVVEDFAAGMPRIQLDRRQMEQVFRHLLHNADLAMRPNGGTLTVRVRPSRDRRTLIIQISDTGRGIPPEYINQVFEPFFSMWEGEEMAGLGLAVCYGIVESHRGSLTLHSNPGEGTTCTITLPAVVEAAAPVEPAASAAPQESRPFAILVVEQQEELREVLRETLQGRGMVVYTAGDSLEAMAALMGHGIDAILLDLNMYTPKGTPVFQPIRDRYPSLPIIALASADSSDEFVAAAQQDAQACLRKPFRLEHLFAELDILLRQRNVA